jgi:rhodanese-related sulfurtransferase/DNA-binding transcriptional ArsR family regulator
VSSASFKHQLFSQFARVAKALGNGYRLELLEFLAQGERSVDALAKLAGLSVANTSQHLQSLRRAGLVSARKDGLRVIYRLADPAVVELLSVLRTLAEKNLAEVGKLVATHLSVKDHLEPVSAAELLQRLRAGAVTALDVRPPEEFAAGHLPGAVNIPLNELEAHLGSLPADQVIVAYCRGPYCVLAYEAVALLRSKGFTAQRLDAGYPEWQHAGLPVETTHSET